MEREKTLRPLRFLLAGNLGVLALYFLLRGNRRVMNAWADTVTTPLKTALGRLCGLVPFSVMELLCVLAAAGTVAYVAWGIRAIVRAASGQRRRRASAVVLTAADILLCVYVLFCLMWGANFWTDSFRDRSGIQPRSTTPAELTELTAYFARQLSESAGGVARDETGRFAVSRQEILSESPRVYDRITERFPFLAFRDPGIKAVRFSRFMSIMGYTGVYFACLGESNVNVDAPACFLPSTVAHELAHQRGVAWEQECNFLGVLASVESGMPAYVYSGWLLGYVHLGNALYAVDQDAYWAIRSTLPETVEADLRHNYDYWKALEGNVVERVSDAVYDAALKTYGDPNGMRSYGMVVDLLAAYYLPQG